MTEIKEGAAVVVLSAEVARLEAVVIMYVDKLLADSPLVVEEALVTYEVV